MMFILMNFKDDNILEIKKINDYRDNLSKNKGREKICRKLFLSKKMGTEKF